MSAKAILIRYLDRNRSTLPDAPLKLREQLASVAERSGLRVTDKELDELTSVAKPVEAKQAPKKKATKKRGSSTKTKI